MDAFASQRVKRARSVNPTGPAHAPNVVMRFASVGLLDGLGFYQTHVAIGLIADHMLGLEGRRPNLVGQLFVCEGATAPKQPACLRPRGCCQV